MLRKDKDGNEGRLKKLYEKIVSIDQYSFEIAENDTKKTIMAKRGEQTSIDQTSENEGHLTSLIKDGNTYLVFHDKQEYYVYKGNSVEQNILGDGLKEVVDKGNYTTGVEKVNGIRYTFEEYSGTTIFTSLNALNIVEDNVKTKFYFNKNDELVYMRTTYEDTEELLKIKFTESTDDALFEIPSEYAENS